MKKHAIIITVALIFLLSGCGAQTEAPPEETVTEILDAVSAATLARYQVNEIQEYQGMRLDPSVGPRDNSINGVQHVDIEGYTLNITGLADNPIELSYEQVLEFPAFERVTTLNCVEGWKVTVLWKGVKLSDLLKEAQAQDAANTVIFKSVDGYTTSMPISTVLERDMLLAFEANTLTLPDEMGYPFIVVAEDKLGYKWARWVNEIELSDNEEYQGYWERVGFGNDAEVSESKKGGN